MGVFTNRTPPPRSRSPRPSGSSSAASSRGAGPAYNQIRAVVAAARPLDLTNADEQKRLAQKSSADAWQAEAWEYYDAIGEIKYALSLVANILSRIRLYAAEVGDPSQPPAPADPDSPGGGAAISALHRLDSAFGGQPGLLRDAALNLCVVGECYLVQRPSVTFPPSPESWDIRSTDELNVSSSGEVRLVTRRDADKQSQAILPRNSFVLRIWRPHPRFSDQPDSSMLGILDACAELLLLNRTFRATARSRLNSGMLYLPDGLSLAAGGDEDLHPEDDPDGELLLTSSSADTETDLFEEQLVEAMVTPITDEESASAVVPLIVRGPAELGDKIKIFKFERSFDPALSTRADRVLERIMQGIDIPKDVVTGLANVKYANAVQIDEALYKAHIEPLALMLCDALTVGYLRPTLRSAGVDPSEVGKYVVWFDPSEVTTRPNKAEDAQAGYSNHLLSGAAWRRAHGFSDEDAPSPEEIALRLMLEKASVTPELGEALLQVFAPDVMARVREASQASNPAPLTPDVLDAINPSPDAAPAPSSPGPVAAPSPAPTSQPEILNPEDLV